MKKHKHRNAKGLTLVEVMVASTILAIIALGSVAYQYHGAHQTRIARAEMAMSRVCQLVIEDWKSTGGSKNYDPMHLNLGLQTATAPQILVDLSNSTIIENCVYGYEFDDMPMQFLLSWEDVAVDPATSLTLRKLTIAARWTDARGILPVVFTTYARVDASGG